MILTSRKLRSIRRASQRRSQNRNGLGISELFLAPLDHAAVILEASDKRLKWYLLGYPSVADATSRAPKITSG